MSSVKSGPIITDDEMWGAYPGPQTGGFTTLIGGNGLNHPTTIGIQRVQAPLFEREFGA